MKKWIELSVQAPPEYVEPLSKVFYQYGQGGVAIEQPGGFDPDDGEKPPDDAWVTVKTYIPLDSQSRERRSRIDLGVRLVSHLSPISSLREKVLEEDWQSAWKKHFHVLHVGKRMAVVPSWQEYHPEESRLVIRLDPGMAFGTGHHPTTRMCLELLEELVRPGMDVLDVGCGSGILSIAAARLGARAVLGLEIDPLAVTAAESNVSQNGVVGTVNIVRGTLPRPSIAANSCDIAVANISARVVTELAGALVSVVRPGGTLIVSGILRDKKDAVASHLKDAGARARGSHGKDDWVSLVVSIP